MEHIPLGEWKLKYGRIFKVQLEKKWLYFRLLTVGEIEAYKKKPQEVSKHINSIILNNESLSSTGAKYKLSDFVIANSFPLTDDDLKERILHHRYKIKDDFSMSLIAKLCSVYVSYTPDQLMNKTLDQLLELVSIAEIMTGKQLLNDKKTKGRLVRETKESNNESFSKPPIDELMEETEQSLQAAMSKFGVKVPTLAEVKSKKEKEKNVHLTDLQKQMKELNQVV
jgi:dsRNA-specific ribonuclease